MLRINSSSPNADGCKSERGAMSKRPAALAAGLVLATLAALAGPALAQQAKKPHNVMLITDETGWSGFGEYSSCGASLCHPTPNIDCITNKSATFTKWHSYTRCT